MDFYCRKCGKWQLDVNRDWNKWFRAWISIVEKVANGRGMSIELREMVSCMDFYCRKCGKWQLDVNRIDGNGFERGFLLPKRWQMAVECQ